MTFLFIGYKVQHMYIFSRFSVYIGIGCLPSSFFVHITCCLLIDICSGLHHHILDPHQGKFAARRPPSELAAVPAPAAVIGRSLDAVSRSAWPAGRSLQLPNPAPGRRLTPFTGVCRPVTGAVPCRLSDDRRTLDCLSVVAPRVVPPRAPGASEHNGPPARRWLAHQNKHRPRHGRRRLGVSEALGGVGWVSRRLREAAAGCL